MRVEREACCDALAVRICGEPLAVARTLVEFAANLSGGSHWEEIAAGSVFASPVSPVLATFADPSESGELTDRVQRLVDPDVAARPRVSWWGLVLVMGSLGLTGSALAWGTDVAVKTTVRLVAQNKPRVVPAPQELSLPKLTPLPKELAGPRIPVTVIVRTDDGKPLPVDTIVDYSSRSAALSSGGSLLRSERILPELRQDIELLPGQLTFRAFAPDYAGVTSPALDLLATDKKRTVELVLRKGTTVRLQFRDEQGGPIAGTQVSLYGNFGAKSPAESLGKEREFSSDARGEVRIEGMGDNQCRLKIRARGFQRQHLTRTFKPSETAVITMRVATPIEFNMVDAVTGQPVPHARVAVYRTIPDRPHNPIGMSGERDAIDPWTLYGETDSAGHVTLNELEDSVEYFLAILAPQYAMASAINVNARQSPTTIKLVRPLKLAGRVEGALQRLQQTRNLRDWMRLKDARPRVVNYSRSYLNITSSEEQAVVDAQGKFEISDLTPGEEVIFKLPDQRERFVMSKSITDLSFKISPVAIPMAKNERQVIVRLTGPSPAAPAQGTLQLYATHSDPLYQILLGESQPLRDNQLSLNIPVGTEFWVQPGNLINFHINTHQEKITAGEGPQLIELPAFPAGQIRTTISQADGSSAIGARITMFASQLPPGQTINFRSKRSYPIGISAHSSSVPLGGRYYILVRQSSEKGYSLWAVSNEVVLDEAHPSAELHLKLPVGRPIPIQVHGPDDQPVRNAIVNVEVEFKFPNQAAFGSMNQITTNDDGIALYQDSTVEVPDAPWTVKVIARIPPGQYRGWSGELDPANPPKIRLQKGLTASGILVEATSGKPIPNADIHLEPNSQSEFRVRFNGTTDASGKFRFEGLEALEYDVHVRDSLPVGTKMTTGPDGVLRFETPAGYVPLKLQPGGSEALRWEVLIHPKGRLKVAD
ncbi:MAG: hypothetical protein JWN70_2326 [Planctomycetaceae bacterium]|nr:hypothetical protein [Planctomycetaceae bacterium]